MVTFIKKQIGCAQALELPPPACPQKPVILVAAAAILDSDSRILIARRPPGKDMAGLWEFPGGKVRSDETPEFALMRELKEELDIDTRPCCFAPLAFASHGYDHFHLLMPLFVCRVWKGVPKAMEGQEIKWCSIPDLYQYDMPPADLPLLDQVQNLVRG